MCFQGLVVYETDVQKYIYTYISQATINMHINVYTLR